MFAGKLFGKLLIAHSEFSFSSATIHAFSCKVKRHSVIKKSISDWHKKKIVYPASAFVDVEHFSVC
jgi:hypothetical protein